ncbi:MAG: HAMP domain-containing histidine kinase [Agathobacter sp.]|nr:HAMP domain-containing histidine kinase [Agathobacter sp.]
MWSNVDREKKELSRTTKRLSREILGVFAKTFLLSAVSFWILNEVANIIVLNYVEAELLVITEYQLIDLQYGILGISFVSAIILFIVLFLFLVGERLAYIREIEKGIDALGRHEWSYKIPLQGKNELTELAELINFFAKEEQAFQEKEKQMQEEKEALVRGLSHDIRTPLTSILSYSEYIKGKDNLSEREISEYIELMEQKAQQIKVLTDRLLDGGTRQLETIENGVFFMQQLVDEWEAELESEFECQIDLSNCPDFAGEFDVQELRRIFDNLASNIKKYADKDAPVVLRVAEKGGRVCIAQSNTCKQIKVPVESTKIGIDSIRKIAAHYGGAVEISQTEEKFSIEISLVEIK